MTEDQLKKTEDFIKTQGLENLNIQLEQINRTIKYVLPSRNVHEPGGEAYRTVQNDLNDLKTIKEKLEKEIKLKTPKKSWWKRKKK